MRNLNDDAEARYQAAVELVALLRGEWERLGKPMLSEGGATGRAVVPHPLIGMIQVAERDADRFRRALRAGHSGPQPVAVPGVAKSPAARLRSVV